MKDADSPKKIRIELKHLSNTDMRSLPTSEPAQDSQKRRVGTLKTILPAPIQPIPAHPPIQLDPTIEKSISQYEIQRKKDIDTQLSAFHAHQTAAIQAELAQFKQTQMAQLQSEMAHLKDQAQEEGISRGQKEGEAQYTEKLRTLMAVISDVSQNKQHFYDESESELLQLSLKIAEKMIHQQLTLDQSAIISIIHESIRRITDKDKVIIKIAPEDADYVRQNRDRILEKMPDIRSLEIHDDPRIERGGCILETRMGYIDSTLTTTLSSIETALFKVYNDQ